MVSVERALTGDWDETLDLGLNLLLCESVDTWEKDFWNSFEEVGDSGLLLRILIDFSFYYRGTFLY